MTNFNKNWKDFLEEAELDTSGIRINDELQENFWINNELEEKIRQRLLSIAKDFINSLELGSKVKDITFTGSLASYNWHTKSDVDLHILLDFSEFASDRALVKDFLDLKRAQWNERHDIFIYGHEVEMYFQDINEEHYANGVYSILKNRWLTIPTRTEQKLDLNNATIKAEALAKEVECVENHIDDKKYSQAFDASEKIKGKIRHMRSSGLSDGGIYSTENLAFKILRNSGILEKLSNLKHLAYDRKMSFTKSEPVTVKIQEEWWKFAKNRQ